jgi:Flp pilus assembly protein TadD
MTRRQRTILHIGLALVLHTIVFAHLPTSSSQGGDTRRGFTLFGDLKADESESTSDAPAHGIFDVILYTRGNELFGKQRVGNGGRYRFDNVFTGDYYLVVEFDKLEVARMPVLIPSNAVGHIRQDLEFSWKAPARMGTGVISAADSYNRTGKNRELYERGMKAIKNNNFPKATEALRKLVEADPKDFPAWAELGMVYFLQRDLGAAEHSYIKATQLKPDHVSSLVTLGRVRLARGNNEGAVAALEAAVKADPNSPAANYFMGEAYLAIRKGSLAITYLNEALKIDPIGRAEAHLRLGALYNRGGRKDLAVIEYNEFLKKKPHHPEAQRLKDYIIANRPARTTASPEPSPSPSPNP